MTAEQPKSEYKSSQAALFEHVDSVECFQTPKGTRPVLHDIGFEVNCGETWCVSGASHFEMRLLLELLSNARPYAKGRCVLCERGMMRKKCVILPHVHYIGGTNMLFNNMNVLEYMMFITSRKAEDPIQRQRTLLQALEKANLGSISLAPIARLTPQERSLATLFTATLTPSRLVVWNLSRLVYTAQLVESAARIARTLASQDKALVFSTADYELAQAAADHLLLLKDGGTVYTGTAEEFSNRWDKLLFTLSAEDTAPYAVAFEKAAPGCMIVREGAQLRVYDPDGAYADMRIFFAAIAKEGLCPESILRNRPNLKNAVAKALVQL